uniref:Uncharacterized protein n=1 Tax=Tanacetum cinerariifolium TaxID=118510 RepID=A0A6L2K6T3_TANCI|nr:hypothetical protein [Tanacetum cinerariifolium]
MEILGESISQEDVNQKFLRSLSLEWNIHTIMWSNKPDLDTLSLDDLYNNLKVFEPKVKGVSSLITNTQNMAFVSSSSNNNTNSSNEAVTTAFRVTTAGTQVNAANTTNIDNLSDAIIYAFLGSQSNSSQLLNLNGNETVSFNKTKVECYNYHMRGYFARECRALRAQDNGNRNSESTRRNVPVETTNSSALVSCDGLEGYDWSDQAKEGPNYALMAYSTLSFDYEIADKCKASLGYNAVPPPYTRNFLPLKPDLSGLEEFDNEPIVSEPTVKKPKVETSDA